MLNLPATSVAHTLVPGGWSEQELLIGDRSLHILLPAQPDRFLEQIAEPPLASHNADPYWAKLWPTALAMARLVRASKWPAPARAIELGCGIGAVGLAGLLSGLQVTFTDRVELAVATAIENARRNGLKGATGCVLDWARAPKWRYPIIFASDVVYDRELHAPLLSAIDRLLADGGECWIGDPGRSSTKAFLEQVAATRFKLRLRNERGRDVTNLKLGEFRLIVLHKV